MTIEFETLKPKIAKTLKESMLRDSATPKGEKPVKCEVHIPYQLIRSVQDEPNTATAVVHFVAYLPNEKRHTVYIKFSYDNFGKFQKETMSYV